jgi:hypothetical protein
MTWRTNGGTSTGGGPEAPAILRQPEDAVLLQAAEQLNGEEGVALGPSVEILREPVGVVLGEVNLPVDEVPDRRQVERLEVEVHRPGFSLEQREQA